MRVLVVVLAIGCSGERATAPPRVMATPQDAAREDAVVRDASAPDGVADAAAPTSDPLAELRARGAAALAEVIERRVAQRSPKMKLTTEEATRVARAVLAVGERPPLRALMAVMPRSTVELARAVDERALSLDELDRIAVYLAHVVGVIAPERLATFDDNHSHVTGRDWHEIDYTGEHMTWQGQRAAWLPQGVESFKRATFIHAYFVGAEKLPHWKRIYRPRGAMRSVTPP